MSKIEQVKTYIKQQGGLKLKGLTKPDEKNPQDFLRRFFSYYNKKLETVYKSNGQIQCMPNKRRSIQDIYLIVLNYFPKASLTKLYTEILKLISENLVISGICLDIHKRVYRGVNSGEKGYINGVLADEFDIDMKTFKGADKKSITSKCSHDEPGLGWGNGRGKDSFETIQL